MTEDELLDDVKHWKGRADAANSMVDLLEQNAGIQAKLLADTARQRDDLVGALRTLDTLLDFGDTLSDNVWTFEDLTAIQAAFDRAKAALDQVTGDRVGGEKL